MSNNRHIFTTYVNPEDYQKFVEKCRRNEITPYAFLKRAIKKYIEEE